MVHMYVIHVVIHINAFYVVPRQTILTIHCLVARDYIFLHTPQRYVGVLVVGPELS